MSISRKIIEHIIADNGDKVRSSIHKSISEKVSDLLESKKIELAGGSLVSEDYSEEKEYLVFEMLKNEEKINKLKEEIAILEEYLSIIISEESSCDDDDDMDEDDVKDAIDKKKKKLKKKEKKAKKMEEAFALLEGDEDEEYEDEESEEEDLSEEQLNELSTGKLKGYIKKASKVNSQLAAAALRDVGTSDQERHIPKLQSTRKGLQLARKKLSEDEDLSEEQLDEISRGTISSYVVKSLNDKNRTHGSKRKNLDMASAKMGYDSPVKAKVQATKNKPMPPSKDKSWFGN